jgi:plastocyanin
MRFALTSTARLATALCLGLATLTAAMADSSVRVRVLDREGLPVPEIAVSARSVEPGRAATAAPRTANMSQHDLSFEPHVLIVAAGTEVVFPNDDDVRHHVYSFSTTKAFDFSVDSKSIHSGLRFDVPGVVTIGCNIHDQMLAYVLVVDTPHFAKTDGDGVAVLSGLETGTYEITIWTSRMAGKHLPDPIEISLTDGETASLEHQFATKLYPPHRHSETSLHWARY